MGVDPQTISWDALKRLRDALTTAQTTNNTKVSKEAANSSIKIVPSQGNLVDAIWSTRPSSSVEPVSPLPLEFSGQRFPDKLARIRTAMDPSATHLAVTALDDIACTPFTHTNNQFLFIDILFFSVNQFIEIDHFFRAV